MRKKENLRLNKTLIISSISLGILALVLAFIVRINTNDTSKVMLKGQSFNVELAKTKEDRARGLSGRENLCSKCGMLFVFPGKGKYSFHMRNMNFPLDIIWILEGKVVHIEKDVPANFEGSLQPDAYADMVLEVNAGIADKLNIKIGDSI